MAQLREGQPAAIKPALRAELPGKVARLNQEADTVTRELEVDVKFDQLPKPLVIGRKPRWTSPPAARLARQYPYPP